MKGLVNSVKVNIRKKGLQVRKGKAKMQIRTFKALNTYLPTDVKGMTLPTADKAERLISVCLSGAGSSGYLDPGASARIPE